MYRQYKLNNWLPQITNNNSQKEYYLTDIVALAKKDNTKIVTHEAKNESYNFRHKL